MLRNNSIVASNIVHKSYKCVRVCRNSNSSGPHLSPRPFRRCPSVRYSIASKFSAIWSRNTIGRPVGRSCALPRSVPVVATVVSRYSVAWIRFAMRRCCTCRLDYLLSDEVVLSNLRNAFFFLVSDLISPIFFVVLHRCLKWRACVWRTRLLQLRLTSSSVPVQEWDEKQLVAILERASLLELQKVLKVHPVKAAGLSSAPARRGRFMPVMEAVANIRLNAGYVLNSFLLHSAILELFFFTPFRCRIWSHPPICPRFGSSSPFSICCSCSECPKSSTDSACVSLFFAL